MQQSTGGGGDGGSDTSGNVTRSVQPPAPSSAASSSASTDTDTSSSSTPARPLRLRTDDLSTSAPIYAATPTTATGIGTLSIGGIATAATLISSITSSPPSRTSASTPSIGVGGTHYRHGHGHGHSASIDSTPSLQSPSDWSASAVTSAQTTPITTPRDFALPHFPLFSVQSTQTTSTPLLSQAHSLNTSALNSPQQSPLGGSNAPSAESTRPSSPKAVPLTSSVAAAGDVDESDDSLFGDDSGDEIGGDDESADTKTSRTSGTRRKKLKVLRDNPEALSTPIECGALDEHGERIYEEDSAYFGKRVEIYTATRDPAKRILYRASVLAEKFKCATNKVGMYLARRRDIESGLYQATLFRHKPAGRSGLKAGGYFLSMEVCRAFEQHYVKQTNRKRQKQMADMQEQSTSVMSPPSVPTLGAGSSTQLNLSSILAWMLPGIDNAQRNHLVQQLQAAMAAGIITTQPSILQIQTFVQHYLALQFQSQSNSQQLTSSPLGLTPFGSMNPSFLNPQMPMSNAFMNLYNPQVPVIPLSASMPTALTAIAQVPSAALERQMASGLSSPTAKSSQSQVSSPRSPHLSARVPSPQPLRRVLGSPGGAIPRPRSVNSPRMSSRTMSSARPPSASSKTPTPIPAITTGTRQSALYLNPSSGPNTSMPSSPTSSTQHTSPPQQPESMPHPSPTLTASAHQSGVTFAELQLQQQLLVQQQMQAQQQQQAFMQMAFMQQQQQEHMQLMQMQQSPHITPQQLAQLQQMQMQQFRLQQQQPIQQAIMTTAQSQPGITGATTPSLTTSTLHQQLQQQMQQQPPWYQSQFRRG